MVKCVRVLQSLFCTRRGLFFAIFGLLLAGCESYKPELVLKPVDWSELPSFEIDKLSEAQPAIQRSCRSKKRPKDHDGFCAFATEKKLSSSSLRNLLQTHFQPYAMALDDDYVGKMTGYYEPLLRGSKKRSERYRVPVYKNPKNFGFNHTHTRTEIVQEFALNEKKLELLWVDDEIDLFFLQIQGSGRVLMDNGRVVRIGYDGQNGQPYFPIGKALVEKGEIPLKEASMQSIKKWLREHPSERESVLSLNQSYVYFRILDEEGPIGAQGQPLVADRSLAIDKSYVPLGSLIWIDAEHPSNEGDFLQKLMVAQDTGGAIKGGLRADYFWGFGSNAEKNAGSMNSKTRLFILLPKKYERKTMIGIPS